MNLSNPTSTPHYSSETVAGKTISEWFVEYPPTEVERNEVTWGILHICFAFWYEFADPLLNQVELERLIFFCENFKPGLFDYLSPTFIIYYYHYVVGKYGHLPRESGFCDYIQYKVNEYLYDENITIEFPEDYEPAHELRRPTAQP